MPGITENQTLLDANNQGIVTANEIVAALAQTNQQLTRLSSLLELSQLSNLAHLETIANCCGAGKQGVSNSQLSVTQLNAKCLKANKMWYAFNWIVSKIRDAEINDTLQWTGGILAIGAVIAGALADGPSPVGDAIGLGAGIAALAAMALADWQKILNDLLANRDDIITGLYNATTDGEVVKVWTNYLQDEAGIKELPFIYLLAKSTTIDIAFNPAKVIVTPDDWQPYTDCGVSVNPTTTTLLTNWETPYNTVTTGSANWAGDENGWPLNTAYGLQFDTEYNIPANLNLTVFVQFEAELVAQNTYNVVFRVDFSDYVTVYEGVLYSIPGTQTKSFSFNVTTQYYGVPFKLIFTRPGDGHNFYVRKVKISYQEE